MSGSVLKRDDQNNGWVDTGLKAASQIAAGPENQVYAITDSGSSTGGFNLNAWNGYKWEQIAGPENRKVKSIGVGYQGRILVTDNADRIWWSDPKMTTQLCIDRLREAAALKR
jgi:hypothetical protein